MDALVIGNLVFRAVEYLGLSLLPLAVVATTFVARARPLRALVATAGLGAVAAFLYLREGVLMPYLPNLVYDFGLGALTLRDTLFLGMPPPVALGAPMRLPLTVVATVTSAAVLACWTAVSRRPRTVEAAVVSLALLLLFAGTLLHTRYYFDRYLLPLLPFAAALTAAAIESVRAPRQRVIGATALLAAVAGAWFSVAGTHDYLAWNHARYALLDELMAEGVEPARIDGGMEFNALASGERLRVLAHRRGGEDRRRPDSEELVVGSRRRVRGVDAPARRLRPLLVALLRHLARAGPRERGHAPTIAVTPRRGAATVKS